VVLLERGADTRGRTGREGPLYFLIIIIYFSLPFKFFCKSNSRKRREIIERNKRERKGEKEDDRGGINIRL